MLRAYCSPAFHNGFGHAYYLNVGGEFHGIITIYIATVACSNVAMAVTGLSAAGMDFRQAVKGQNG